jgi:hypothetical protein
VHLTDEEVEIRHRLYWSCYFWDKIVSLYLGRSPSLQHTLVSPPQIISKLAILCSRPLLTVTSG